MSLKAENVFKPGAFPEYTYVSRNYENTGISYELRLKQALRTAGCLTSIIGPSKMGKTILCEQVIGLDNIVEVSGADFNGNLDFWAIIAAKVGLPYMGEITTERSATEGNNEERDSKRERYILSKDKIIQYYIENNKILVIDDFHYASPEMQLKMAQQLKDAIRRELKYDEIVSELNRKLEEMDYPKEFCEQVKQKQRYLKNRFSDEANKEKMLVAKDNLLKYLVDFLNGENGNAAENALIKYLTDFYMFIEALCEREPDKRATLTHDMLQKIKIENEYDLQHLLYAVLKPLYPDIRKEVAVDSGVGTVRSDLKIPCLNSVVETKCTRENMSLKKFRIRRLSPSAAFSILEAR